MTKAAFDKIAAGLNDALAYAGGEESRARVAAPIDVKGIRKATGKTQDAFAAAKIEGLGGTQQDGR